MRAGTSKAKSVHEAAIYRSTAVVLIAAGLALGDGGLVPGPAGTIEECGQVAIISHFEGRERLALATSYAGDVDRFAWVIPVPAEPTVDSVGVDFFRELQEYTQPLYRSSGFGCGGGVPVPAGRFDGDSLGVEEIAHGFVGVYEYEILRVDVAESLAAHLIRKGYVLRTDPTRVFDHYIAKGWRFFFVAQVHDSLRQYETHTVGIRLTFPSDSAVYPLYISRIGSRFTGVVLYVFAEHRLHFDGAELLFSGPVGPRSFVTGNGFVARPCQLTKLRKYYSPEEMEDIVLFQAPDDRKFRKVLSSGDWYGSLGPMVLLAGLLLFSRRK